MNKPKLEIIIRKYDQKLLDYIRFANDRELRNFVASLAREVAGEVLDTIASAEGWEETRDHYAKIFGLPEKYIKH